MRKAHSPRAFPRSAGWLALLAPVLMAAQPPVATKVGPGPKIQLLEASGARRSIATRGRAVRAELAPDGSSVAVLVARAASQGRLPGFELRVLDSDGRLLTRVRRAQRFRYAPSSTRLAVIVGPSYEGALGFKPEAVEIVRLPSGKRRRIRKLSSARKIAFIARPEGERLFVEVQGQDSAIVRYDLRTDTLHPTALLGLECSPDGRFYWLTARETLRAGLCTPGTPGDRCIRAFSWKNAPTSLPLDRRIDQGLVWQKTDGHTMVFMESFGAIRKAASVNLETGEVKDVGPIAPDWSPRPGWVVRPGSSPQPESLSSR